MTDASGPPPGPWTNGNGNGARGVPWWVERGPEPRVRSIPPDDSNGFGPGHEVEPDGSVKALPYAAPMAVAAAAVLLIVMGSAAFAPSPILSRVLIPVAGFLGAIAAAGWLAPRHPDETWIPKLLALAVLAKIFASVLRYRTLVNSYGDVGDASVFDTYGQRYAGGWRGVVGKTVPELENIRKSNFVRWFTGVVYYLFGTDMIAGFIVFGLIAFIGSYLWYRATVEAVPFLDKRLYFLIVMFVPSVLFWPSSIGKEALMQFAIGSAALGTAHIFNGKLVRGILVAAPGAWLMSVVRPHLLALVALAAAAAFLIGRSPRKQRASNARSSLVKPIGLVLVTFIAVFAVSAGANSLGLPSLSLGSVQAELDATSLSTGQGGSSFDNGGNSLSPLHLPQGMVTVLLRPFPFEVDSQLQVLASLEGVALAALIVIRRKSLAISLRHLRTVPFLFYCWTVTILYALTFQAFANFGLLVRQRSLVLPALYVLLCIDWKKARAFDEHQDSRLEARALRYENRGAR